MRSAVHQKQQRHAEIIWDVNLVFTLYLPKNALSTCKSPPVLPWYCIQFISMVKCDLHKTYIV